MLPALFLTTAGLLYVSFGIEAANQTLDSLMASLGFRLLLSPVVVLGGPLVAFGLNAWQVFHVSADFVNDEFVIALSVKRLVGPLICRAAASGLMTLLAAYAFVENFKVVVRS
jgi:hypothetical protein